MIYLIVSRSREVGNSVKVEAGTPLHIKISGSSDGKQPIIGFETIPLAEKFLDRNNIPKDEYKLILKDRGQSEHYENHPIFLVESETQLDEMERDSEGYDYEKHIYKNAL